jgi:membrane protein DedA with SNARE-associated domain
LLESIIHAVTTWITGVVSALGYGGIVLLMGIESACIPLPSEIIMPYGGYLAYAEPARFSIWGMGLAGALGCVWGSLAGYAMGKYGGRPFALKYGRWLLMSRHDLDKADRWFQRYGDAAVFFGRLLPVIRTFISFPAGVSGMHLGRFVLYTFLGSLPWCTALAWAGKVLGEQWDTRLKAYFHGADALIGVVIIVLIALYIYYHIRAANAGPAEPSQP